MKKLTLVLLIIFAGSWIVIAQDDSDNNGKDSTDEKQKYTLQSKKLEEQGKELDAQIDELNKKISAVIKNYELFKAKNLKTVPYQTTFKVGENFIEIERYRFKKDDIYRRSIVGIRTKGIKIFVSGDKANRIVSKVYENNQNNEIITEVLIDDPSPDTPDTSDIKFTQIQNNRVIFKDKSLGSVKNTTAFPMRNDIKRKFIIPHLTYFYNSALFIAESYYKSLRDTDGALSEFLIESSEY